MAFCLDQIEDDYERYISKKSLRKKYTAYCKEHKINVKSDFIVKKVLQELYGVSEERKEILGETWEWVWSGVKWKN